MPKSISKFISWVNENVVGVLVASLIIPGVLAIHSEQHEITKMIFESDYKRVKDKYLECSKLHDEYMLAASKNSGAAHLINENFNYESLPTKYVTETYLVAFKSAFDTFEKSGKELDEKFLKASLCYRELAFLYENVSIILGLREQYKSVISTGSDEISSLVKSREELRAEIAKKYDPNEMYGLLIAGTDESIAAALKKVSYLDLANLQERNVKLELAIRNQQNVNFNEINILFSEEIDRRFNRGLLAFLYSLI